MIAWFFRIGEFSLINDALSSGLRSEFPELEWREIDVERDVVRRNPTLFARANAEATLRYGRRILRNRQPPRDFFPRLPSVIEALQSWVRRNVDPAKSAFVFQTQSLFDARHPALPHFLYTDHTYLANRRYPEPRPELPVAENWLRMERDLYRNATCNFVSSGFAAASVREDYEVPEERVECVFSGCNVAPSPPETRSGRVVLFVGVDWERKGGPELVEAFKVVRSEVPDAELWIVGCSPGIRGEGVREFGRISAAEVRRCYAQADVFCLPSRMDPSASVLAEAAANRLPVVATAVGGNAERVLDGQSGYLCGSNEIASRLIELLRDPAKRLAFGERGRQLVEERFTWEAVSARIASRIRKEMKCRS